MNRNTQAHFANLPAANIGRSKFDRSFTHKTSWKNGQLIPVFCDLDIVPGDTVSMKQAEVVRLITPVTPVMDNAIMDFYWFFIPNRLVMTNFKRLMGENTTAPWTSNYNGTIPQLKCSNDHKDATSQELDYIVEKHSVLDYLGIPPQEDWTYVSSSSDPNYKELKFSNLPVRAYCLCWNEFFRDENLQNPCNISLGDSWFPVYNTNNSTWTTNRESYITSYEQYGGLPPLNVCKTHDYFTSCLPGAQKGPAVTLPLSNNPEDSFVKFYHANGATTPENIDGKRVGIDVDYNSSTEKATIKNVYQGSSTGDTLATEDYSTYLYVDLERATGATVTQLRQAFAIQKFYERDARGGTRYIESVWNHFGVRNPDYRLQRPEYLGGWRQRININQVVQNSESTNSSPLGETGAYSVTTHSDGNVFTHSFTEHGILLGLMCCRQESHTYAQGINRAWFKKERLDFYSPEFANLSEMAVKRREIFADGSGAAGDEQVFGYQEAWAEMRYFPDRCSSDMRPDLDGALGDVWTWADWYTSYPQLGDKWIQEGPENIDRTLAINDAQQFWGDFYFGATYTRPMPLYSIPGLIDHH